MEKRTREKIALVVFALLVVLAGIVLVSYFATGRSWNMAASFVDDTIGSMDGYTVVAYAGTVEPEDSTSQDGSSGEGAEGVLSDADSDGSDGQDALSADGEADAGDAGSPAGTDADSAVRAGDGAAASDADAASPDVEETPADDVAEGESTTARKSLDALVAEARSRGAIEGSADGGSLGLFSFLPSPFASVDEHVYVSDVRRTYEDKNANVLTLDVTTNRYVEPEILSVGGKRIGVYSTKTYVSRARTNQVVSYFDENDVDVVIFVTPMSSLLATYEGVDVVIVTSDREEGLSTRGENVGDTFVVRAPEQGEVGVVLLTTNNVASAKVISSL